MIGSVSLVAGTGGNLTSVVMVLKSTFNETLVRGEVPPGLRAPDPGTEPNISGAWEITGVPDGEYVVLAAFENDHLVRDPDPNMAGTELQYLTVANGAPSAEPTFKVTIAITIVSPGAGDAIETVSATPTFSWAPYSSAKSYEVMVFDVFGVQQGVTAVLNAQALSGDPSHTHEGVLAPGIYLWRVLAKGQNGNPISVSEELRGVFQVE